MLDAASLKLRRDLRWRSAHMRYHCSGRSGVERTSTENENRFLAIRPRIKRQDRLKSLAPDDKRVHRGHEFIVAVRFATAGRQEIKLAVGSGDEAVDAGPDKDRCFHYLPLHIAVLLFLHYIAVPDVVAELP